MRIIYSLNIVLFITLNALLSTNPVLSWSIVYHLTFNTAWLGLPLVQQVLFTLRELLSLLTVSSEVVIVCVIFLFSIVGFFSFCGFKPLYCMTFFDFRLLVTPFVSLNSYFLKLQNYCASNIALEDKNNLLFL